MKLHYALLLTITLFLGCEKEKLTQEYTTSTVSDIFYFEAQINDSIISKNLAWYGTTSFYSLYHTEVVDEYKFSFTWGNGGAYKPRTMHPNAEYYSLINGGFVNVTILDSTKIDSIMGNLIPSDKFGENFQVDFGIGVNEDRFWAIDSIFDVEIKYEKDTTMVRHYNRDTEKFKIYTVKIPRVILRNSTNDSFVKEVRNFKIRYPVIVWD
jgi:hypothetical protein